MTKLLAPDSTDPDAIVRRRDFPNLGGTPTGRRRLYLFDSLANFEAMFVELARWDELPLVTTEPAIRAWDDTAGAWAAPGWNVYQHSDVVVYTNMDEAVANDFLRAQGAYGKEVRKIGSADTAAIDLSNYFTYTLLSSTLDLPKVKAGQGVYYQGLFYTALADSPAFMPTGDTDAHYTIDPRHVFSIDWSTNSMVDGTTPIFRRSQEKFRITRTESEAGVGTGTLTLAIGATPMAAAACDQTNTIVQHTTDNLVMVGDSLNITEAITSGPVDNVTLSIRCVQVVV